ncbi:hypothetical protein M0804_012051 [Polistes exclamans]|nr:hypothetical protein M0804_012051 [Polistes exclamans]
MRIEELTNGGCSLTSLPIVKCKKELVSCENEIDGEMDKDAFKEEERRGEERKGKEEKRKGQRSRASSFSILFDELFSLQQ